MSLKQNIVIKSEFTNNAKGRGSRGATPGQYVMRYMAREDATEVLAPVHVSYNNHVATYDSAAFTRYMAREDATEQLLRRQDDTLDAESYGSPLTLKHKFRQIDKQSGRAFGSRGLSLTHEALQDSSDAIQEAFDNGHTVQKAIISFTEDYLRENDILDDTFQHKGRGSYKGKIDQLKLREAITSGVDHLTRAGKYANPEWVGTVQLDTSHVHAHIALVDKEFSKSRIAVDGADRGKINEREKRMFRKGVHHRLNEMTDMKSFHSQVSLERQNVVAFVKDYAYATIQENTQVQLLLASLPKNRKDWRYKTNRASMKHANELATDIVENVFEREPERSGYDKAIQSIERYVSESSRVQGLDEGRQQEMRENGRERLIERSVNGLYNVLKDIDSDYTQTRTVMTDIQSSSDEELANALSVDKSADAFDAAAFTLRVRGYRKREEQHHEDAGLYYDVITEFDNADIQGLVDDSAHVMRSFYEEEMRYHMQLTDKYRSFLSFHRPEDRQNMEQMKPAYEELVERYHQIQLDEEESGLRLIHDRNAYQQDLKAYTFECFDKGLATSRAWEAIMTEDDNGRVRPDFVLPEAPKVRGNHSDDVHFHRVKALDVHHLGLDYYNQDARISPYNASVFANTYQSRLDKAEAARDYVSATGQVLPEFHQNALDDIHTMEPVVQKAMDEGLIQTVEPEQIANPEERQLYTISADYYLDVAGHVSRELESSDVLDIDIAEYADDRELDS